MFAVTGKRIYRKFKNNVGQLTGSLQPGLRSTTKDDFPLKVKQFLIGED